MIVHMFSSASGRTGRLFVDTTSLADDAIRKAAAAYEDDDDGERAELLRDRLSAQRVALTAYRIAGDPSSFRLYVNSTDGHTFACVVLSDRRLWQIVQAGPARETFSSHIAFGYPLTRSGLLAAFAAWCANNFDGLSVPDDISVTIFGDNDSRLDRSRAHSWISGGLSIRASDNDDNLMSKNRHNDGLDAYASAALIGGISSSQLDGASSAYYVE